MKNNKNILRVGTLLCILIFLLLPLMSSPLAGVGTWTYTTTATTTNTGSGPTATCAFAVPYTINGVPPTPPNWATFTCTYTFSDTYPARLGGQGSKHRANLTVTPGGTTSTGWITINANGGIVGGTITLGPYSYTSPASWEVRVDVWCYDIASTQTAYYYETHTISTS